MPRARFTTIERDVVLATAGIAPDKIAKELAKFARSEVRRVITAGEASPIYTKFVNGRRDADEDTVIPPGPILYDFSYWEPILKFTLDWLHKNSPVLTGRYQASHEVMLGSQFISADTQIAADEEPIIVNTTPYSRTIEVGHTITKMPEYIYQRCAAAVKQQFGKVVKVQATQVLIPGGYVLKGRFRRGHKKFSRTGLKKDTQAGARMTYPALKLRMI